MIGGSAVAIVAIAAVLWWGDRRDDHSTMSSGRRRLGDGLGMIGPANVVAPATLGGRVTRASDGAAIEGAVVALAVVPNISPQLAPPQIATSDRDGRWTLNETTPGSYALTVTTAGFVPHTQQLSVVGGQLADVDVMLSAGGALVTGTITDDEHKPIAGARVLAHAEVGEETLIAISGSDGRYRLGVLPGSYGLEVTHEDYCRAWHDVTAGDEPSSQNVVLMLAGTVRGQVMARDTGMPVADAIVTASGERDSSEALADGQGMFVLRGLSNGPTAITARAKGYASGTPTIIELGLGQHANGTKVVVDPAASIIGRVVAANEPTRGIAGATVHAVLSDGRFASVTTLSNADGSFELVGMMRGWHLLAAEKRGLLLERRGEVEIEDRDVTGVTITMREGVTLSGRVEPPGVATIALARATSTWPEQTEAETVDIAKARTQSDVNGVFTLRDVPDGNFELSAMAKDGRSGMIVVSVTSADQSGLAIRLSPRASVTGRVIDTNGKPVSAAIVLPSRVDVPLAVRHHYDGQFRGSTTSADGAFKVIGLDPGIWQLSVAESNSGNVTNTSFEVDVSDGADHDGVTIVVEPRNAHIRGNVVGADRKPAVGAQVYAMRQAARGSKVQADSYAGPVRTDAAGTFVLDRLRPGTYTLVVEHPRTRTRTTMSGVVTGTSVTVALARLSSLTINISYRSGPTRDVQLSCEGHAQTVFLEHQTDGVHTFTGVAPGEYRCTATTDTATTHASVIVGGEPATLTMSLEDHGSLAGIAVNAITGQPVAGLSVLAPGTFAETDATGRFVIERVPAGSGELVLTPMHQFGVGHDKHPYTAKPGERVDVGRIKVVPPRAGDVGTFGLSVEVRGGLLTVTKVKPGGPAHRAGLNIDDVIVSLDGEHLPAIGADRARRFLASEAVSAGQTVSLILANDQRVTMTAIKW